MPKPSGHSRTSARKYRENRAEILAESDICGICRHPGAKTADHIIAMEEWLRLFGTLDGFDDKENLQPAHGTMSSAPPNPCPICNRLCNQSRGKKPLRSPHSKRWR